MGSAQLGHLSFRLNPSQISYATQVDTVTIDTIGGQVIQILGVTVGDITISGEFGQDHKNHRESWQLAQSFHNQIKAMMDAQVLPPKKGGGGNTHAPIRFTFNDGVHNWDFMVMIKSITDLDGTGSLTHSNGKFAYGYKLTLFLVKDHSLALTKVASDKFIERIAKGVGWKKNKYSGAITISEAEAFIAATGAGSLNEYVAIRLRTGYNGNGTATVGPSLNGSVASP